jgi:hypothetical protein
MKKENFYNFLKNNMVDEYTNIIKDLNKITKQINNKERIQLYNYYDYLYEEYGVNKEYIKFGFSDNQRQILDANLADFIEKSYQNKWFENKTALHVGSGLGRNLPLLVYLGCNLVYGLDIDESILKASDIFLSLYNFKDKIKLIHSDFLKFNYFYCDIFYYIGGTIPLKTNLERAKFTIAMKKIINNYKFVVYTRGLFTYHDDFNIIEKLVLNNKNFYKLYSNTGFQVYIRK